jgi:hypothetical protein
VRLDERVLDWLKSKGQGHLTLINDILANMMEAERHAATAKGDLNLPFSWRPWRLCATRF